MATLFEIPAVFDLPLSKGKDLVVDFIQKIDGVLTDYAAGMTVTLVIETDTPITATAVIDTYHAVCRIESTVADTIPKGKYWRVVVSYPTTPTTEDVPMNGKTIRADGRAQT